MSFQTGSDSSEMTGDEGFLSLKAFGYILQMRVDKNNLQKSKNVVMSMNKVLITGCFGYSVGTAKSFTISVMI